MYYCPWIFGYMLSPRVFVRIFLKTSLMNLLMVCIDLRGKCLHFLVQTRLEAVITIFVVLCMLSFINFGWYLIMNVHDDFVDSVHWSQVENVRIFKVKQCLERKILNFLFYMVLKSLNFGLFVISTGFWPKFLWASMSILLMACVCLEGQTSTFTISNEARAENTKFII